ncbi:hypothetical protein ACHAXS_002102 [Conticribra weissflogii]
MICSGFSVSKGISAIKEKVKRKGVTRIYTYFATKHIGHYKTLEQVVDGIKFFIYCQKDEKYVSNIMSWHGVLTPVEGYPSFDSSIRSPFHTTTKQSIGQFTFLLEVAEACAENSRAWPRKEKVKPQLVFHQELAQKLLINNLDNNGMAVTQIGHPRTRG